MKRILNQMVVVAVLLLALGQPAYGSEWNPTASDERGNTAGGTSALAGELTDCSDNTAFGRNALGSNTTGNSNTASGAYALGNNGSGKNNTANGHSALGWNTRGYYNTASGASALYGNTRGSSNTASGYRALYENSSGEANTASGRDVLKSNTAGNYNTASGTNALESNTTGSNNTASGRDALKSNTTGNNNLALGNGAGSSLTSGSDNIYLGHHGLKTESETMRLGHGQTRTFVAGVANTAVTGSAVFVTGDGQLGVEVSSARYKQDIAPLGQLSEPLYQLRPVTFHYRQQPQGPRQYGLIAEEVATVYPELVTRDTHGEVEGVRYQALISLLLNELQHQHGQLRTQAQQLNAQAQQLSAILEQLAELRAQNETLRAVVGHRQVAVIGQSASVAFDSLGSR